VVVEISSEWRGLARRVPFVLDDGDLHGNGAMY
jgi:hypothetical protein